MNQFSQDLWKYAVITVGHIEQGTENMGFLLNQSVLNIDHKHITTIYGLDHTLPRATVYCGGPLHTDRCTVLHSPEYRTNTTRSFNAHSSITFDNRIIRDIVQGRGPQQWKIMLGHCEWRDGQLDAEIIREGGWQETAWSNTAWGNYKRKDKMWRRIIEQCSQHDASLFLNKIFTN
jgi:putative AlgH/UPF0301 family transcriptional regulator